ncbi:hypothetical protein CSB11_00815 [Candidatus Campbellbacteria bacterium]|nr:MAG: hypothetical protein CSB11_00815 [Candidatus Campbellbacteria bacterium]
MRIWSLHPKYLDSKGLVALWRETLLAKNVLEGKTKGYKNHPQLDRFKEHSKPKEAINYYLSVVYQNSLDRGYNFNKDKFQKIKKLKKIKVTDKQVQYEFQHLLNKLKTRDKKKYQEIKNIKNIEVHSMFEVVKGEIETWEILKD